MSRHDASRRRRDARLVFQIELRAESALFNLCDYDARQTRAVSGFTRGRAGGGPPRVTPYRWVTPEGKKFVGKFTKNSGQNEVGQVKRCGLTPSKGGRGVTPE